MRLKIKEQESTRDGKITIFASESAVVPLVMSVVLFPLSLIEYVKRAQRSGLHIVVSPSKDGIHVYSCGLALDEVTGRLEVYEGRGC
ncbi:MAG TPA: hypothetical protein VMT42_02570 [candidate division Zixibacteria bacterium]|nr:hypothetical protein [candidate division Zixibacteria bacterium]